ncbi:MAG: hypothetical protein ACI4VK_01510 [Candidatus Coproplasma sp.]
MAEIRELEYYLFKHPNVTEKEVELFAYGNFYSFFRRYDKESGEWVISKVSFSAMLHDFWYEQISEERAEEITGGNLPVDDYKEYCRLLSDHG